ncbi:MAG TPA: class I SAM-dependent methyltransferase [Bryobacteraceae bacterium]|nr:class I SAM-dependent methyltransferase [Bryobacteraceae bacterium]
MNHSHSSLTDWGLRHVTVGKSSRVLDVGCGGGRTIQKLSAMASEGSVYGVDYAEGSVRASHSKNAALIRAGRGGIAQGTVSQLPFPDASFDLVTAVETQYYWPDMPRAMQEVLRVLKPGGTLIVIAESYKRKQPNKLVQPLMKVISAAYLSVEEERALFAGAGFVNVEIFEERGSGWLCAAGQKSSLPGGAA